MQISERGQVTIPKKYREKLGFLPFMEVDILAQKNYLKIIKKNHTSSESHFLGFKGIVRGKKSTDQLMKLLRHR
jgi:bifunctional DNA-binding transcriptional regulator/antitoxin component of YhaV-PrlF toxin-antitoxin module